MLLPILKNLQDTVLKKLAKSLDFLQKICYNISVRNKHRDVAQLVARLVWERVTGSKFNRERKRQKALY